jgi:hypothetical protein
MPDSFFHPKNGFAGADVPPVDAPDSKHGTLTEPAGPPRQLPWVVTFMGYILLAAIGLGGAFLAWVAQSRLALSLRPTSRLRLGLPPCIIQLAAKLRSADLILIITFAAKRALYVFEALALPRPCQLEGSFDR